MFKPSSKGHTLARAPPSLPPIPCKLKQWFSAKDNFAPRGHVAKCSEVGPLGSSELGLEAGTHLGVAPGVRMCTSSVFHQEGTARLTLSGVTLLARYRRRGRRTVRPVTFSVMQLSL